MLYGLMETILESTIVKVFVQRVGESGFFEESKIFEGHPTEIIWDDEYLAYAGKEIKWVSVEDSALKVMLNVYEDASRRDITEIMNGGK